MQLTNIFITDKSADLTHKMKMMNNIYYRDSISCHMPKYLVYNDIEKALERLKHKELFKYVLEY